MGADMIVSILVIPVENVPKLKELFAKVHENIDKSTRADIEKYHSSEGTEELWEEAEVKQDWHSMVTEVEKDLDCREVTSFTHGHDELFITGGMSWGDSPTDTCNDFDHFTNLPSWIASPVLSIQV